MNSFTVFTASIFSFSVPFGAVFVWTRYGSERSEVSAFGLGREGSFAARSPLSVFVDVRRFVVLAFCAINGPSI